MSRFSDLTRPLLHDSDDEVDSPDFIELQIGYQSGSGHVGGTKGFVVKDLDQFLTRIYRYHTAKGFWPAVLKRFLNLLQLVFVAVLTTVVLGAVDYSILLSQRSFAQSFDLRHVPKSHPVLIVCLVLFVLFWIWEVIVFLSELKSFWEIRLFYREALLIPDEDMETILWREVVRKLIAAQSVHRFCRVKSDITEHDVVNRIMRRENFLIGLFNKDVLPMKVRIPILGYTIPFLPKSLEWSINKCVLDYVFDHKHCIKEKFLQEDRGDKLAEGLTARFRWYAGWTMVMAPFMSIFLLLYFFFQYAAEFKREPRSLGMRHWSSYLRWKAREFNELPHIFHLRLSHAYLPAENYLNSFTSETVVSLARFTAFVSGACLSVLIVLTVIDEGMLQVHLTADRSVVWWLGLLGTVLAGARALVPSDHLVLDPEGHLAAVGAQLHCLPALWKGHYHSVRVKKEFSQLFEYKAVFLLSELLGAFVTPLILWLAMPSFSRDIIDFFRHFTVYRDGVGHVCSFAMFDFKRHGNIKYGVQLGPQEQPSTYEQTAEGKMEKSFLNFTAHHPDWQPPPEGQELLEALDEFSREQSGQTGSSRRTRAGTISPERVVEGGSIHEATHTLAGHGHSNQDDAIGNLGWSTLALEQMYDSNCLLASNT